jgi:hypothetical protein
MLASVDCSAPQDENLRQVARYMGTYGTELLGRTYKGRVILKGTPYVYLRALSRPNGQAPPLPLWSCL